MSLFVCFIQATAVVDTSRAQQPQPSSIIAPQVQIPILEQQQQQPPNIYPQSGHFSHHTSPQPSPGGGQFQNQAAYHHHHQHHQHRVLTSSNSFDSKSHIPAFASYHMSAEAAKLFATLQQSPLPIPQNDVINYC